MRFAAARGFVLLVSLVACGPAPAARARAGASGRETSAPREAAADAGVSADEPESVESLVARGAEELPSMKVVGRSANVVGSIDVTAPSDTCFRGRIASSTPVEAWFEDAQKSRRGDVARVAGLVPPRGPVCARKGETLRLVVLRSVATGIVRGVVWQSP